MNNQERLTYIAKRYIAPHEWPTLRGVIAYWENETLRITFYFSEMIADQLKANAEVLATEILAQFNEGFLNTQFIYLDLLNPLPISSFWIYKNIKES